MSVKSANLYKRKSIEICFVYYRDAFVGITHVAELTVVYYTAANTSGN